MCLYIKLFHVTSCLYVFAVCPHRYGGLHKTALCVVIHPERHWHEKKAYTRDYVRDAVMLCEFACLGVFMHRRLLCPSAVPKRLYSVSRISFSVIICSFLRGRQSCRKLREGLPAVRLQAKIFVTQSPVAVSLCISQSLSFPFNSFPSLSVSLSSRSCSKR